MKSTDRHVEVLLFLSSIAFLHTSCASPKDESDGFPIFSAVAPLEVFKLGTVPEQKMCVITDDTETHALVKELKNRYPGGWHKPHYTSLAPAYRIASAGVEIWALKQGWAIFVAQGQNARAAYVRDLPTGEAEAFLQMVCNGSHSTTKEGMPR